MNTVYQSKFLIIKFDEDKKIIKSFWSEKNSDITDKQVKNEIANAAQIIKEYKPFFIISDDRSRVFVYSVEIQKWVNLTLHEASTEAGVVKFAILLPEELVAKLSTEQVTEEHVGLRSYELKMFFDEDKALKWLDE